MVLEKRKRAYVYTRVSTIEQVDGNSLEGQLAEIREYCNFYHIDIVGVYSDEGRSGKSIDGRPAFKKMLEDIANSGDIDYVVVWKLSRFGRNARETLNAIDFLSKHNCSLISKEDKLDSSDRTGRFMISLLSSLAEMERENIAEQSRNGKKYNALNGNWNGGTAPYGYRLENKKLVIIPEQAEVVKLIFDYYVNSSMGYGGIALMLNRLMIPTKQFRRINRRSESGKIEYLPMAQERTPGSIRKIIRNPVYCGMVTWRDHTKNERVAVQGNHEPIITPKVYERAKQLRGEVNYGYGTKRRMVNRFVGVLDCPVCKRRLSTHVSSREAYSVYRCRFCDSSASYKDGADYRSVCMSAKYVDNAIFELVYEYLTCEENINKLIESLSTKTDTEKIRAELEEINNKLRDLDRNKMAQYEIISKIGVYPEYKHIDTDIIVKNIESIELQRAELMAKQNRLEKIVANDRDSEKRALAIRATAGLIIDILKNGDEADRYTAVKSIIDKVEIEKAVMGDLNEFLISRIKLYFSEKQLSLLWKLSGKSVTNLVGLGTEGENFTVYEVESEIKVAPAEEVRRFLRIMPRNFRNLQAYLKYEYNIDVAYTTLIRLVQKFRPDIKYRIATYPEIVRIAKELDYI